MVCVEALNEGRRWRLERRSRGFGSLNFSFCVSAEDISVDDGVGRYVDFPARLMLIAGDGVDLATRRVERGVMKFGFDFGSRGILAAVETVC